MAASVFALMKATGRPEAEILDWPIERFNTYVELLNEDNEAFANLFRKS